VFIAGLAGSAALAIDGAVGPMLAGSLLACGGGYVPLFGLFAGATALGVLAFAILGQRLARRTA